MVLVLCELIIIEHIRVVTGARCLSVKGRKKIWSETSLMLFTHFLVSIVKCFLYIVRNSVYIF